MTAKRSPEGSTRRIPSGGPPGRGLDREEAYDDRRSMRRSGTAQRPADRRNSESSGGREQSRMSGSRSAPAKESGRPSRSRSMPAREPGRPSGSRSAPARESGRPSGSHSAPGRGAPPDRRSEKQREGRSGGARRSGGGSNQSRQAERPKSRWKLLLVLLLGTAFIAGVGFLAIQLFETKKITVTGNQYVSEQEIIDWLLADEHSGNSLYLLWKYNQNDVQQLPAVEETKVGLKNLVEVQVQVKEKSFSGRIDYNEAFLYFDQEGIASLITGTEIEGVPYIEGMEINPEEVLLGSVLPVTDGQIFEELKTLMPLLEKQELSPDRISCAGADLTLHFGGVRVQIGSGQFADRLAQVPPILEKLAELYADQTGVLHLENYDVSGSSIRFVPDTAAQPQPETQ